MKRDGKEFLRFMIATLMTDQFHQVANDDDEPSDLMMPDEMADACRRFQRAAEKEPFRSRTVSCRARFESWLSEPIVQAMMAGEIQAGEMAKMVRIMIPWPASGLVFAVPSDFSCNKPKLN